MGEENIGEFIERHRRVVSLTDGSEIAVRPIAPTDRSLLVDGSERLSPESRWNRFLRPVARLTERELVYLTEIDHIDHVAWVAVTTEDPATGIGVARYVRDAADPQVAEAAVVAAGGDGAPRVAHAVGDPERPQFPGIPGPGNVKSREFLINLGATGHHAEGLWVADIPLPTPISSIRHTPLNDILVAAAASDVKLQPPAIPPTDTAR